MKITLTQTYEIEVPKEYEKMELKDLVNSINAMYDINGKDIIKTMSAENDYLYTRLSEINGEEVFIDNNDDINYATGYDIILDGQKL